MFNIYRGTDNFGGGWFGAPRGNRPHLGLDIITSPGEPIYAPHQMEIYSISYPYSDTLDYRGVKFTHQVGNASFDGRLWYFEPLDSVIGKTVEAGELIGYSQSLQNRYRGITDHVHVQYRLTSGDIGSFDSLEYKGNIYANPTEIL